MYLEVYANVFCFFFDKMVGFLTQPFYNNLVNVSSTPLTLFIGSFQNIAYMLQTLNACASLMVIFFYAPLFSMVGYIVSLLSVCPSVRPVLSIRNKNCFRSISFEKISLLNSNFIHRYIIIKCRPSSI